MSILMNTINSDLNTSEYTGLCPGRRSSGRSRRSRGPAFRWTGSDAGVSTV